MKCPHCNNPIGVDSNPFQYETITFMTEDSVKKRRGKNMMAIFCNKCDKVIGICPMF